MRMLLILAAIAAALLAYILVFERDTVSDGEIARRQGRVLPNFVRDRVIRLKIKNADGVVVLVRKPDPDGIIPTGIWHVEQPYKSEADQDAVETLMGELEWMDARRRLEDVSEEDKKQFGFSTPRMEVSFEVGRDKGRLIVGSESTKGDGHYVMVDGEGEVFIVGSDLTEALSPSPNHYHTKMLHDGVMLAIAKRVELREEDKRYVAEKKNERWWLESSPPVFASETALETICDTLDHLLAKRFITSQPDSMKRYGLDEPHLAVKVVQRRLRDDAKSKEGDARYEMRNFEIKVGKPCADHESERYATVAESGPIYCVADAELAVVRDALLDLAEGRLAPLDASKVDEVLITRRGAGKTQLRLRKTDEGERYAVGTASDLDELMPAEEGSVQAFLTAVTEATVEPQAEGVELTPGPAIGSVTFSKEGKTLLVLDLYDSQDGIYAERQGEGVKRHYSAAAGDRLKVDAAPFRMHKLLTYASDALREVSVVAGSERETAERLDDGSFALTAPASASADVATMLALSRLLGGLEAASYEPVGRQPGMVASKVQMRFAVEKGMEDHTLTLFATPDSETQLARLDDDSALFAIAPELAQLLGRPWLDRHYASVQLDTVQSLSIVGPKSCTVVRDGGELTFEGDIGTPVQAQKLVTAWSKVRAREVAYGQLEKGAIIVEAQDDASTRTFRMSRDEDDEALFVPAFHARLALDQGARASLLACP